MLKAMASVIGAAALMLSGITASASATELSSGISVQLGTSDKYELAAEISGMTVSELQDLEAEGEIIISDDGLIMFVDLATEGEALPPLLQQPGADLQGFTIPGDPVIGSRPDAPVTLAIVFDGFAMVNKRWNEATEQDLLILEAAQGLTDEMRYEVWARVAELYAPFNINVVTGIQPDEVMHKTHIDDDVYGAVAIVTDTPPTVIKDAPAGLAGIALFNGAGAEYLEGALMFASNYAGQPADTIVRAIAETIAHEVGHNFGLDHHGFVVSASENDEYYTPTAGVWGPVMGISDYTPLSQWSDGSYANATKPEQGDLQTFVDHASAITLLIALTLPDGQVYDYKTLGACVTEPLGPDGIQPDDEVFTMNDEGTCDPLGEPLDSHWILSGRADMAPDTVGDTIAEANTLDNTDGTFAAEGVVIDGADRDFYSFTTSGGGFTAAVDAAMFGPSLNAKLTLYDSLGEEIASSSPDPVRSSRHIVTEMGASLDAQLGAGRFYLAVEGAGSGDPAQATRSNANGFSEYASVGNYRLTGTAAPFSDVAAVTFDTPQAGTKVDGGSPFRITGTAAPHAFVAIFLAGSDPLSGDTLALTTADADGAWATEITAIESGEMRLVAAQTVGGIAIDTTASLMLEAVAADSGTPSDRDTPVTPTPEKPATSEKDLAQTGTDSGPLPYAFGALLLIIAGAATLLIRRKFTLPSETSEE